MAPVCNRDRGLPTRPTPAATPADLTDTTARQRGHAARSRTAAPPAGRPYQAFAQFYDAAMGDAVFPALREAFERACARHQIAFRSAADVGCGTGSFLRHLAGRADPLFGVDHSAEMLQQAARKTRGCRVRLLQQDLRALSLPSPVDLITCNFDTLNYLHRASDLSQAFERLHGNLNQGGHLLFDLIVGVGQADARRRESQVVRLPGVESLWRIRADPDRGASLVEMRTRLRGADGRVRQMRERHLQRWYPQDLVRRLLQRAGFRVLSVQDMDRSQAASEDSFWVQFTARGA